MKKSKRIIAIACALLMTASASATVFANELPDNKSVDQGKPAVQNEMADDQKTDAGQMAEDFSQHKPAGEFNGEAPSGQPEENAEKPDMEQKPEKGPADGMMRAPEKGGMHEDKDAAQDKRSEKPEDDIFAEDKADKVQPPVGGKTMDKTLSEINGSISDSDKSSFDSLMNEYRSAVDSERETTDADAKMTAAQLVKSIVDKLNDLLEKAGLSVRIERPEDKPEMQTSR